MLQRNYDLTRAGTSSENLLFKSYLLRIAGMLQHGNSGV
jgi:hypothetical protein